MSIAAPPSRPSPGTSFEHNPMFSPRSQVRSHHTQTMSPPPPPATQFFHIPPTPDAGSTKPGSMPLTPNVAATNSRKAGGSMSPTSGYFSLAKDENETHISSNWSAGSSLRSAAGRSPMVLDMDSLPPQSEEFRRQSSALAQTLNPSAFAIAASTSRPPATPGGGFFDQAWSAEPPTETTVGDDNSYLTTARRISKDQPSAGYNMPRFGSPANTELNMGNIPKGRAGSLVNLSLPSTTKGPITGEGRKGKDSRSSTLPSSSKVDGLSLMYGSKLASLLDSLSKKDVLLLDLRPYQAFSLSRIEGSLNLSIPTTLLKRPSFNVAKLIDCLGTMKMKEQLADWKDAKYIVAYDASSRTVPESIAAAHTVNKFIREGWTGEAYLLSGGFEEFEQLFPAKVDRDRVQEETKAGRSLSLSSKSDKPAFNCPIPSSKSAANPFFSNIRQNMDLIGGVGEMPIALPPNTTAEMKAAFPKWIKELACGEGGSKKVADKFLKIEKAEQTRMQEALNCSVSYDCSTATKAKSHTLAGVEKGAKNRYNNIWPYDHARVKLIDHSADSCDYVNASFVSTEYSSKRYIATQGPLPSTFQDFWSVVWDQDVRVIVMLTAESEGGQLKCHSYWSDRSYGPYNLSSLSERRVTLDPARTNPALRHNSRPRGSISKETANLNLESPHDSDAPHVIMRKFTLSHSSHPFSPIREITQLQYSSWPDFGAPADPAHILGLIEQTDAVVRSCATPSRASTFKGGDKAGYPPVSRVERPVLVHCSAGCGRTGTFCTADSVIDMLRHQRENIIARNLPDSEGDSSMSQGKNWMEKDDFDLIDKAVNDLRDQRLSMVQSLRQFVLCYETVLEWLVRRPLADGPKVNWTEMGANTHKRP